MYVSLYVKIIFVGPVLALLNDAKIVEYFGGEELSRGLDDPSVEDILKDGAACEHQLSHSSKCEFQAGRKFGDKSLQCNDPSHLYDPNLFVML